MLFTQDDLGDRDMRVVNDPWHSWRIFHADQDAKLVCYLGLKAVFGQAKRTVTIDGVDYYRGALCATPKAFMDAANDLCAVRQYHRDPAKGIDWKP